MALLKVVGEAHPRTYFVKGRDEPESGTPAPMSIDVDDDPVELRLRGSQHSGACVGVIAALVDAHARGATDVLIETDSELLRNHGRGEWPRNDVMLAALHRAIDAIRPVFDSVRFS